MEWTNDNDVVRKIWQKLGETAGENIFSDINEVLSTNYNKTIEEAVVEYTEWRYFTESRDDGMHFELAKEYPLSNLSAEYSTFPQLNKQFFVLNARDNDESFGGTSFIELAGTDDFVKIEFNGDNSVEWNVTLIEDGSPDFIRERAIVLNSNQDGSIYADIGASNKVTLISTVKSSYFVDKGYSIDITLPELSSTYFATEDENSGNLNGNLFLDDYLEIESGITKNLPVSTSHSIETIKERFIGSNVEKHNNWNVNIVAYKLTKNFNTPSFGSGQQVAKFETIKQSTINVTIDGGTITGKGDLQFHDPWYLKSNGTQPDDYLPFTSPYKPNGKEGASEKGAFVNQGGTTPNLTPPYYSVKVEEEQTIDYSGSKNLYFQNWSSTNADVVTPSNLVSGYYETPIVFRNTNSVVNANYKGTQFTNTSGTFNKNNQNKIVRVDGKLYKVYESMNRIWLEKSSDNGSTWEIMNNGKPIDVISGGRYPSIGVLDNTNNQLLVIVYNLSGTFRIQHWSQGAKQFDTEISTGIANVSSSSIPVVSYNYNGRVLVAWSNNGVVLYQFGNFAGGSIQWYPSMPQYVTSSNSNNVSISKQSNSAFHVAWQEGWSNIKYAKLNIGSGGSSITVTDQATISTGSGYPTNSYPSITTSSSGNPMYGSVQNNSSTPYTFTTTSSIGSLSKTSSISLNIGRGFVITKDSSQFFFIMGDVALSGEGIGFEELPAELIIKEKSELDKYLLTEPFQFSDSDELEFSLLLGASDSIAAKSVFRKNEKIKFSFELIEDGTNKVLGKYEKFVQRKDDILTNESRTFKLDGKGIGDKFVKLKMIFDTEIKGEYTLLDIRDNTTVLPKIGESAVSISYAGELEIKDYTLSQNFPNPFNPSTIINYQIPNDGFVSLKVYDITGQEVATLVNQAQAKGRYEISFPTNGGASKLSSGVYLYRLTSGSFTKSMKMLLLK